MAEKGQNYGTKTGELWHKKGQSYGPLLSEISRKLKLSPVWPLYLTAVSPGIIRQRKLTEH